MRVVALSLMLEIILFIKLPHISDGSFFTSVSTYLQNKNSYGPTPNPQYMRMRASEKGSNMPLCSHREPIVAQGSISVRASPRQWGCLDNIHRSNTDHSWPTCSLHNDGVIHELVCHFGVNFVVQTLHPTNTRWKISFRMKICGWKYPPLQLDWRMKTREECGGHHVPRI